MPLELFPYQVEGEAFLSSRARAYLADEPGLGKTPQAIRACDTVKAKHILVLCPASLKSNWRREFGKFSLTRREVRIPTTSTRICPLPGVTIVNYDIIAHPKLFAQLVGRTWDVVICDEGHYLKSLESKRTRAAMRTDKISLHQVARRWWMLSGTPAPNHPGELYPAIQVMKPSMTLGKKYKDWLNHYCYTRDTLYGTKVISNRAQVVHLRRQLQDILLRRKAADVLPDLPDVTSDVWLLDGEQARKEVERVAGEMKELDQLMSLADSDYLDEEALEILDESELATLRRLCGTAKAPILAKRIADELDHGLECVILMCWHHATMDILQRELAPYGVARVDGNTKDPDSEVQKFQLPTSTTDCRVFVGQIVSAGVGHTMTRANQMVLVEPSWVPGDNDQAIRRIKRIGQKNHCVVRWATLSGTLDEVVMESAKRKTQMINETY